MNSLKAGLYIVATPIGNLEDLSDRAKKTLNMVDIIICENPNHSMKLLNKLGIKKKLFSLHDYNEEILIKRIEKYQLNSPIALISDAGSPLISDPGYKLVLDYIKKDIFITSIPGPSSIISALQLSGLPNHNFKFLGFAPKNKSSLQSLLSEINESTCSSIILISGNRLLDFLKEISIINKNKKIAVSKELTKINERVFRGNVLTLIKELGSSRQNLKGEFIVITEGKDKKPIKKLDAEAKKQIKKLMKKFSLTEVVEIVHKLTSISKKEIYKNALLIKND